MMRSRCVMLRVGIVVNFLSVCVSRWSILKISCRILSASRHMSHALHLCPTTKQWRKGALLRPAVHGVRSIHRVAVIFVDGNVVVVVVAISIGG